MKHLGSVTLRPPVLREIVGTNHQVFGDELVARRAVGGKDALIAVSKRIKLRRAHARTIHFINKHDGMTVVIIAPEAGALIRKLIVASLAFRGGQILAEAGGRTGFAAASSTAKENDIGGEVAGSGLDTGILGEGFVITNRRGKVSIPNSLTGSTGINKGLDLEQIRPAALIFFFA